MGKRDWSEAGNKNGIYSGGWKRDTDEAECS